MSDNINTVLIGIGNMGVEYSKVLKGLGVSYTAIGRGEENARHFEDVTSVKALRGGVNNVADEIWENVDNAIVAVSIAELYSTASYVIDKGVKHILLEKPGGISYDDINGLADKARDAGAEIYIAYNRRFYASVEAARTMIEHDGGVLSFSFEFTEWSDDIESLPHPQEAKDFWLMTNSSHVIDLAFFLGGYPKEISCYQGGEDELLWHKAGCRYMGAGVSQTGALFAYQANWNAPGRWGVEILTKAHRLYLRPMETLQVQQKNSVAITPVEIDDALEKQYKPGLYKETEAFLGGRGKKNLLRIEDFVKHLDVYKRIENGAL